jgi:hypothetical protein
MPLMNIVLGAFIGIGVVIALQGVLATRGRRQIRPNFFERPLMDVVEPKNQAEMNRALGYIRLGYGVFFVVVGVWAMVA